MATNRLAGESSPYLQQHAHNPVDWYPWGSEALQRAAREDKPILLSIGYSACHWCHVMAHESFEDEAIAQVMNEHFVNIKVDREERPELDHIYQTVCQLLTRAGGWPLTVFLTPEQQPFFAGTYFPPDQRYGRPGFREVLLALSDAYREARAQVADQAGQILDALQQTQQPNQEGRLGDDLLRTAKQSLLEHVDRQHGGFGDAPKFPNPFNLDLLLRAAAHHGDEASLKAVCQACRAMRAGGIFDQLAGGFHRYSVDDSWSVPHFEKMLYDNALLPPIYLAAGILAEDVGLVDVARETLDYLLREMQAPDGGFYATTDADSEGEEGKYFVWTPEQVAEVLEPQLAALTCERFGIGPGGNFEHGATVLHLRRGLPELAAARGQTPEHIRDQLELAIRELLAARASRVPPFRDEKILACWNGLAIRALAMTGAALGRDDYLDAARRTAAFIRDRMMPGGRLQRVYKDGTAKVDGYLDDHGAVALGLLELFCATGEAEWYQLAGSLLQRVEEGFADVERGDYYMTPTDGEPLLMRPKNTFDNATPSGLSLVAHALVKLAHLTGEETWRSRAARLLSAHAGAMRQNAWGTAFLIGAADALLIEPEAVVVVGDDDQADALLQAAWRSWRPARLICRRLPATADADLPGLLHDRGLIDGQPATYVCQGFTCQLPATGPDALSGQLAD